VSTNCTHHLADVRDRHRQERCVPRPGETLSPCSARHWASWLSFIGHTKDSLWSVDLFRCESIVLRSYRVLVVMDPGFVDFATSSGRSGQLDVFWTAPRIDDRK
jgi:hypothetical protein